MLVQDLVHVLERAAMAAGNGLASLAVGSVGNDGLAIDHRRSIPDFLARASRSSATPPMLATTPCSRARIWPKIFRCVGRSDDSGGSGENGAGSARIFLRSRASWFSCGVCRLM